MCSKCGIKEKIDTSRCLECRKEYYREYRKKNADKIKTYRNQYMSTTYKNKKADYDKEYRDRNKEKIRKRSVQYNQRIRLDAISRYGGICSCCGESELGFLSIDHIEGGGNKHRKTFKTSIYRWLKKNNYPDGFQILCHNCNMAKAFYGMCPHQRMKR